MILAVSPVISINSRISQETKELIKLEESSYYRFRNGSESLSKKDQNGEPSLPESER